LKYSCTLLINIQTGKIVILAEIQKQIGLQIVHTYCEYFIPRKKAAAPIPAETPIPQINVIA
jgi:hypothetical protein